MTVPINSAIDIPNNLEELVSYGKIEPAVSLSPEPVLSVLAILSSKGVKKSGNLDIFEEYILNNLLNFKAGTSKTRAGIFLNCASLSQEVLHYFTKLNLVWVNADNIEGIITGAYNVNGIAVFSIYKNFPFNQKDVMNWFETKHENIIPVLLTKKHVQNTKFMEYIITVFDNSKHIKPATPYYIFEFKKNLLEQKDIYFKQFQLNNADLKEKLYSAVSLINSYADSHNFKRYVYNNARNELVYLCSLDLLDYMAADRPVKWKMFDTAYANIYRLLGVDISECKKSDDSVISAIQIGEKNATVLSEQTIIEAISNGVAIYNKGLLNLITVVSQGNSVKVHFSLGEDNWTEKISFIDLYIDLNNINGVGSTSFLNGVNGFLTTESGWEYALRIYKNKAVLYKHSLDGASIVSNLPVDNDSVVIPHKYIRGNPVNWGYQAILISEINGIKVIADFLNQSAKTKEIILSVKPFQTSTVRFKM
jgi:hypothetical protein